MPLSARSINHVHVQFVPVDKMEIEVMWVQSVSFRLLCISDKEAKKGGSFRSKKDDSVKYV